MSIPQVVAFMVLIAVPCAGQRPIPGPSGADSTGRLKATASVVPFDSAGHRWRRYTSQRFVPVSTYAFTLAWPIQNLVLHETSVTSCCDPDAGHRTTFTVAAFKDSARGLIGPIWRSRFDADLTEDASLFYRGVLFGCCSLSNKILLVSLKNGRVVFESTDIGPDRELPSLEVPNTGGTPKRFVAFHDRFTPSGPQETRYSSDLIGVLQYGAPDGPAARVLLRCPNWATKEGASYQLDSLAFRIDGKDSRHAMLWSADHDNSPSALSGFQVHVTLVAFDSASPRRLSVIVPISHDSVDIAHAVLPGSCSLSLARHIRSP